MSDETAVRLALLEAQMEILIDKTNERDKKLDELLALKNRGLGAIWLATLIFGSSVIAGVVSLIQWFR